jgi:hypothetical protein
VYINNKTEPSLVVPRLRGVPQKGGVAFWGRVNDQPTAWAAALSNISIRPSPPSLSSSEVKPIPPSGTLHNWEVAAPVQSETWSIQKLPEMKDWRSATAEESGLVNLNRVLSSARGRWTAFAKTTVKATEAKNVLLELGYSDEVTVFVNGEPVYVGINGFESRHPEYMGFVKAGYEKVIVRLRPGDNEIILAVTDDQRFGWGFIARMVG